MTATILAALFLSCSSTGPIEPVAAGSTLNLPIVEGPGYTGVIFPRERAGDCGKWFGTKASGYWTPSPEVIAELETKLRPALEGGLNSPEGIVRLSEENPGQRAYAIREIAKILDHLGEYRRQYVGIVVPSGARRVFVNFFRRDDRDPLELEGTWRRQLIVVDDGGFWYWTIQFEVDTSEFGDFQSNGYA